VPRTLVDQWWREFHTRITTAADETADSFQVLNLAENIKYKEAQVAYEDIRIPAANNIKNNAPWGVTMNQVQQGMLVRGMVVEIRQSWLPRDRVRINIKYSIPFLHAIPGIERSSL